MPIKVLEKSVCELIAAGEVVERPASVVKELLENAIDAGADAIEVELRRGGLELIRVTDNGCGIPAAEVPTAFLRHATSKISGAQDLEGISTLGFRGEALAAICAVSRVKLISRTRECDAAALYRIEGGEEVERAEAGAPCGTTISVSDLFFNTPARMKFLKKDVYEGNAAQNMVEQLALSHPEIAFRLVREGRVAFSTNGRGGLAAAAFCALPREIAANMIEIKPADSRVRVNGLICKPQFGRPSRSLQFVFVNGRFVKSRSVCAAAEEAGRGLFMSGKHPAFILNLRLPLEDVDINVHPAKTEVRFKNEREATSCVYAAVKLALGEFAGGFSKGLSSASQIAEKALQLENAAQATQKAGAPLPGKVEKPAGNRDRKPFYNEVSGSEFQQILSGMEPLDRKTAPVKRSANLDIEVELPKPSEFRLAQPVVPYATRPDAAPAAGIELAETKVEPSPERQMMAAPLNAADLQGERAQAHIEQPQTAQDTSKQALNQPQPDAPQRPGEPQGAAPAVNQITLDPDIAGGQPAVRYIGEAFDTYIIAQCGEELLLIDKHAAHERLLFEKLRQTQDGCERQMLLEPVVVSLSGEEKTATLENLPVLEKLGFVVGDFGEKEVAVREIPTYLNLSGVKDAVVQMASQLALSSNELTNDQREWLLHSSACRAAIKAGHRTSAAELIRLAEAILREGVPKFCPHGRPVYITLHQKEIEKQFGRA